ncbi:uncharacterized protein LOC144097206 [Amblyomma americanum]
MWWYVMACAAVLLCITLTAVIFTLTSGNDDAGGDGTDKAGGDSSTNMKPLPPSVPIVLNTVPPSALPTSRPTSPTPRPVPLIPKVCTVEDSGVEPLVLPADGLCSFVFYHPLRITDPANTFGTQDHPAQQIFFDRAKDSFHTRFGMSVNYSDMSRFASAFRTTRGKQDYEGYWNYNIFDWGFLFVDEFQAQAGARQITEALRILKEMEEYLKAQRSDGIVFTFLGIYTRSNAICAEIAQYMNTIFTPSGVIVLGHLTYSDSSRPDCNVMPPTSINDPRLQGAKYGHSLRDALHLVRCLQQNGVRTHFSVSTTMRGRWTNPTNFVNRSGMLRVDFYDECQRSPYREDAALKAICDYATGPYARNLAYDTNVKAVITFDEARRFALAFDNENSLREKICDAWESVTDLQVAVAIYDINHDNRDTRCEARWMTGAWARLRLLLRLSAFIERYYKRPEDQTNCHRVT